YDEGDDDGGGWRGVETRVEESEYDEWVDPGMRIILGVGRKKSPENFSGDGAVTAAVAGGGGRPPVGMRGREWESVCKI
ncbi:hypothetical protein Tco_0498331, partial [Tanacetum coccineum]